MEIAKVFKRYSPAPHVCATFIIHIVCDWHAGERGGEKGRGGGRDSLQLNS